MHDIVRKGVNLLGESASPSIPRSPAANHPKHWPLSVQPLQFCCSVAGMSESVRYKGTDRDSYGDAFCASLRGSERATFVPESLSPQAP